MSECRRPVIEYPTRVPLKIIGHGNLLRPELIAEVILRHLGPQPEGDQKHTSNCKGTYTSYTFWVTLPDEHAEQPLRDELHKLPGVVMQL